MYKSTNDREDGIQLREKIFQVQCMKKEKNQEMTTN